ncbi:hypothetical protein AAMO2058_000878300 [Amorphochlora amoebiformis]
MAALAKFMRGTSLLLGRKGFGGKMARFQLRASLLRVRFMSQGERKEEKSGKTIPLVDRLPRKIGLYIKLARMDRPIGSWLLMLPCWWGTTLATSPGSLPSPTLLAMFMFGSIVMRGAGCTINDLWDRDLDAKVERTKDRPLVVENGVSVPNALTFLGAQLFGGLTVLANLNYYTQVLSLCSMPLVVVYPLMKRITYLPQIWLGMVFNWGVLVGYASQMNTLDLYVVGPLYISGILWTVFYDTIYAHQDKRDDVTAGVKSSALLFGDNSTLVLSSLGVGMVGCLYLTGENGGLGLPYYILAVGGSGLHISWQLLSVNFDSPKSCRDKFISNQWLGLIVFLGLVLGRLYSDVQQKGDEKPHATSKTEVDSVVSTGQKS